MNSNNEPSYLIPQPNGFSICALEILPNCSCRRILKPGLYPFDDLLKFNPDGSSLNDSKVPKDFFGPNITVHAIVDTYGHPTDTRTPTQKVALRDLVTALKKQYPHAKVYGHRQFANKACPCFDAEMEYSDV